MDEIKFLTADTIAGRFTGWVIRRRWWVLGLALALTIGMGSGGRHLGLSTDYRTFFSADNPDLLAYEELEDVYSRNDNVLFVIKASGGTVFTPETLDALRALTEDAWQIPYSSRVDGITNFQHTWADGDNLIVEDLLGPGPVTPARVERVRQVAMHEPLLVGRLIAADGRTAGINVRINLPGESTDELPATAAYVRDLKRTYNARYPELEIHTTGIAMLNMAFAEAPLNDIPVVMPLMFGMLLLAIVALLRSASSIAGTVAVILFSIVTAVGAAGHLGVFFDPTSASAPTIILTLAVADSVHILVSFLQRRKAGVGRDAAIVEAMELNAQPVLLTSITTAIGFLTLNFSDSPPFRLLGNVTAFGVMIAWAYSMTVLPALLTFGKTHGRYAHGSGGVDRLVARLGDFVAAKYRQVLVGSGVAVVALAALVPTLEINDRYFDYFAHPLPIRTGTEFALDNLTGVYTASFSLDSGRSQGVADPEFLETVQQFTQWLEARRAVAHVNSFSHTMKRLNMNMHADDPAYHRQPNSRNLGAQYLLLYELSLPYGLDVNDQINIDKSALRVDVTFGDTDIATVEAETAAAEAWLQQHGTPSMRTAKGTGPAQMFAKITRRNIDAMVLGTGLGFILIAAILTAALKSVRMGLLSLIPNIVPTLMAFGFWALFSGEVGFAISVIAGLSVGIIVDDTVHFLTKYNGARRRMSAAEAVRHAFANVGPAILATTAIVAAGFAMLGFSTFRVTAYMGLLTSLTIVCALVVDFLLLPALLIAFDRRAVSAESAAVQSRYPAAVAAG
ncbi:MAG: MMPL family transporter [Candidatus Latescibacteria bacterium]|nr:MMPL family transporter [Candidatus Latescibacterota bacterium]